VVAGAAAALPFSLTPRSSRGVPQRHHSSGLVAAEISPANGGVVGLLPRGKPALLFRSGATYDIFATKTCYHRKLYFIKAKIGLPVGCEAAGLRELRGQCILFMCATHRASLGRPSSSRRHSRPAASLDPARQRPCGYSVGVAAPQERRRPGVTVTLYSTPQLRIRFAGGRYFD
jgi:hypothetical protein